MYLRDCKNFSKIIWFEKDAFSCSPLNEPEKISLVSSVGNIIENIKNTNATLKALPVITSVVLIPAAIPLLF
jgi:hypothetical protein